MGLKFFKFFIETLLFFLSVNKNFTSLPLFIYPLHLLNLKNSYLYTNRQSPQILISRSQKVMFSMILGITILGSNFFVIFFRNIDLFPTFKQNSIYLSRFIISPHPLNLQNSYMYLNHQSHQILISRPRKVMFFEILGKKI